MKQPFRFFRGELNGWLINIVCTFLNIYVKTEGLIEELVYNATFQWKLPEDVSGSETAIREDDIFNIGKVAGLFGPMWYITTNMGSIRFTESTIGRSGQQISERGLFSMSEEQFKYFNDGIAHNDKANDINKNASSTNRSTHPDSRVNEGVPGKRPIGWVLAGAKLYRDNGSIDESVLHYYPSDEHPDGTYPSEGDVYIDFYGDSFLTFEHSYSKELPLDVVTYKALLEAVQWIRYNGTSIISFLELTQILGGGYMRNIDIVQHEIDGVKKDWYDVYYDLDPYATNQTRERKYLAWQQVVQMKFKHFRLHYRSEEEIRGNS